MAIRRPRFDSLFARLLATQAVLVGVLVAVLFGLFNLERNVTVAMLYAERWAPHLAAAAGLAAAPIAPEQIMRRDAPPAGARRMSAIAPRFMALRDSLRARGVPVDEVMLSFTGAEPTLWLRVAPPARAPVWLGVAGQMVVPEWSRRTLLALLVVAALVVGVSWTFTRRLTRPLERLRERMQSHAPGQTAQTDAPAASIAPEIVAIDAAYADLLARLQQHERERSVLLAGVSHDLRGPLARIRMAAELLPDAPELAPRKASIERNVQQADRLIESFLDHVRAGRLALDETVDLAAAGRAVVAAFARPLDQLSVDAPATLQWPNANHLLIERLIANLVDNALKHGAPPVRVTIAAGAAEATIEVEDRGAGFAPGSAARLQEAFTRGDASRSTPGSGLGLAIARQVTARLGGTLDFEGRAGRHVARVRLAAADPRR